MSVSIDKTGAVMRHQSPVRQVQRFNATGSGAAIPVNGRTSYAIQVVGVGGTPTAWDVRLEGTVDGTNWTELMGHATGEGNGTVKFSGANRYPVDAVRFRVNGLTIAPATDIDCFVEAQL